MQQQHSDTQHSKQASRVGRDPKMCFWFDVTYVVDWPFRESTTYSYRVTTPNVPLTLQLDLSSSTPLPLRTIPDGISIRLTRLNDWASTRSPSSLQFNFIKCRRVSFFSVRLQNKKKRKYATLVSMASISICHCGLDCGGSYIWRCRFTKNKTEFKT